MPTMLLSGALSAIPKILVCALCESNTFVYLYLHTYIFRYSIYCFRDFFYSVSPIDNFDICYCRRNVIVHVLCWWGFISLCCLFRCVIASRKLNSHPVPCRGGFVIRIGLTPGFVLVGAGTN